MTSIKSEEKEKNMFNFSTKCKEIDKENSNLFRAATLLQELGNEPGLTTAQFALQLERHDIPADEYENLYLAAKAIETMMSLDLPSEFASEPTVH